MFRQKKRYTIDELNAYKVAYGKPIANVDYTVNILVPSLVGGAVVFLLLHNFWVVLPVCLVYGLYGYRILLPKNVQRFYLHQAFDQRNKFLNNLVQLLTDPSLSWFRALSMASERCSGEFRDDLDQLLVHLQEASTEEIPLHFAAFTERYTSDVVFVLFMEQVETIALEGRTNIDMIRDLKTYHNQLREERKGFMQRKKRVADQIVLYFFLSCAIILGLHVYPLGLAQYVSSFAQSPVGWITCGVYMVVITVVFHKGFACYYDDEIMEVTF